MPSTRAPAGACRRGERHHGPTDPQGVVCTGTCNVSGDARSYGPCGKLHAPLRAGCGQDGSCPASASVRCSSGGPAAWTSTATTTPPGRPSGRSDYPQPGMAPCLATRAGRTSRPAGSLGPNGFGPDPAGRLNPGPPRPARCYCEFPHTMQVRRPASPAGSPFSKGPRAGGLCRWFPGMRSCRLADATRGFRGPGRRQPEAIGYFCATPAAGLSASTPHPLDELSCRGVEAQGSGASGPLRRCFDTSG